MRKIAIILNSQAGVADRAEEIERYISSLPKNTYEVHLQRVRDNLEQTVETFLPSCDTIIAGGGDGTVNAVASIIIKHKPETILGVLPCGTFNHFAKDIGIPIALTDALDVAIKGKNTTTIDAACCNDLIFLNNSSIGVYAKVIRLKDMYRDNGLPKWVAFAAAIIRSSFRIPKIIVSLNIEGMPKRLPTSFVFVGNNVYDLENDLGQRASLQDGKLCVWVARKTTFTGLIELMYHAVKRKVADHKDFDVYTTTEVTIETRKKNPISVSLNGEALKLVPPLKYKIMPRALQVRVQ